MEEVYKEREQLLEVLGSEEEAKDISAAKKRKHDSDLKQIESS